MSAKSSKSKQQKVFKRRFKPRPINPELLSNSPTIRVLKKYGRFNKVAKEQGFLKNPVSNDGDRFEVYDTTSGGFHADLSPMVLGPVLIEGTLFAHNIEDGWQGCKVWQFHMRGRFDKRAPNLWRDEVGGETHDQEGEGWLAEWQKWSEHIR